MYASFSTALKTGSTERPLLERAKWLFASPKAAKPRASAESIRALNKAPINK